MLSLPLVVLNSELISVPKVFGSWLTIPAKMISEMPLPIPCSVISSPIHISKIEPAVIAVTEIAHCQIEVPVVPVDEFARTDCCRM